MSNKRTLILSGLGIIILLTLIANYWFFHRQIQHAKAYVKDQLSWKERQFLTHKAARDSVFMVEDTSYQRLLAKYFEPSKALQQADSSISYLFFSDVVSVSYYDTSFLACLYKRVEVAAQKEREQQKVKQQLKRLIRTYGSVAQGALERVSEDVFLKSEGQLSCLAYNQSPATYQVNEAAFDAIKKYIKNYRTNKGQLQRSNAKRKQAYLAAWNAGYYSLNSSGRKLLTSRMSKSKSSQTDKHFHYRDAILGELSYTLPEESYDTEKLKATISKLETEQYANNQLRTGGMPYAYCFGGSNSCSGYGCSQIKVRTPSNSDVLVSIKRNGRVYRHAYIQAGSSFTFRMPDGRYQAFFYYGKGWNPNKFIKKAGCGKLKGGFVSGEHVDKDDPQYLSNAILSYELILQRNGNLQTKSSNKTEAF